MPKIIFVEADGKEKEVEAKNGLSILEIAHENDIDLEGACEGSLACSTCHIIFEQSTFDNLEECANAKFKATFPPSECPIIIGLESFFESIYSNKSSERSLYEKSSACGDLPWFLKSKICTL